MVLGVQKDGLVIGERAGFGCPLYDVQTPRFKITTAFTVFGRRCGDGQESSLVDCGHICGFRLPISCIILNDAQTIDPEEFLAKSLTY
jgi:hypothetical protein